MKITHFENELETQFKTIGQVSHASDSFRILFDLYAQAEATQHLNLDIQAEDIEGQFDTLGQTQDILIELSASLTAKTMDDILFKMAMWRRHAAQIDPFDSDMTSDERLGYSVFRDLAQICQYDEVLTEQDKQYLTSR